MKTIRSEQLIKISMFLYMVCLLLPAVAYEYGALWGIYLLLLDMFGLLMILIDIVQFNFDLITMYPSALANPLYLTSLYIAFTKKSYNLSLTLSLLSVLSMATFIFNPLVPLGMDWNSVISIPKIGYYTWLLAGVILIYANYHLFKESIKTE